MRDGGGGPLSGPVAILGSQQLTLDTGLPETLSAPDFGSSMVLSGGIGEQPISLPVTSWD